MTDDLQPGPETDRLIAEAIHCFDRMEYGVCIIKIDGITKEFKPCIDLNDSFLAAEGVGLFGCHERFLSGSSIWEWSDPPKCVNDPPTINMVFEADTPAMAICKAILAPKKQ